MDEKFNLVNTRELPDHLRPMILATAYEALVASANEWSENEQ